MSARYASYAPACKAARWTPCSSMPAFAGPNELTPLQADEQDFVDMMLTNALSPMRLIELFADTVASDAGIIAVVSSDLGSITLEPGLVGAVQRQQSGAEHADEGLRRAARGGPRARCCSSLRAGYAPIWAARMPSWTYPKAFRWWWIWCSGTAGKPGLRFTNRHGETLPW